MGTQSRPIEAGIAALAHTVSRFSTFALAAVGLLAVSGLTMGALTVGSLEALPGTGYGRTLLLKLGIVLPVVALAAWTRFVLLPEITGRTDLPRSGRITPDSGRIDANRGRSVSAADGARWDALVRTLRNEAALLVAVLAVTGMLTNTAPGQLAGTPSTAPTRFEAGSQGLDVAGTLSPAAVGENQLSFTLTYQGIPLTTDQLELTARLPEQQLGPLAARPTFDPATGRYSATLTLPAPGQWQLQFSARVDTFAKPVALITVPVT